jgi:tetratricopeptide (TPR) repeat protein
MVPTTRSSLPAQADPAANRAVIDRLENELAALREADALRVLGIDASADDAAIRRAYLVTSKRYHPHTFARYHSPEIRKLATEAYVLVQRAYAQLSNSPRMPAHEAGAGRSLRAARYEDDVAVTEAVRLMELHQYPEAIRLLVAVLNTDPDKLVARLWLNLAGARHARELGETHIAAECYRAVLALQPDHPEAKQQLSLLPPPRRSAPQLTPGASLIGRLIGKKR